MCKCLFAGFSSGIFPYFEKHGNGFIGYGYGEFKYIFFTDIAESKSDGGNLI